MAEFRISVDLSDVMAAVPAEYGKVLPLLSQAVRAIAQQTKINWMESVQRAKLWSGEKDAYSNSITWQMTGDFSAVVQADYRYADEIEQGRPARDLKRMLDTSLKVRTAKDGSRYLIIPFRHSTPGNEAHGQSMPTNVYELAKELRPSRVTGQTQRLSGTGAMDIKNRKFLTVNQNVYKWGGRLNFHDEAQFMAAPNATKHHQGMVRFDASTPGGKRSSTYLTFREIGRAHV